MKHIFALLLSIFLLGATTCEASWLIFHKPEFRGKIVDIETHEPIEGAVVVAIYRKEQIGLAPDSIDIDIDAREALTDRNGEFVIPSYTTPINPLSWSIPVQFIIFKPGYYCAGPVRLEEEFSGSKKFKIEITAGSSKGLKFRALETGVLMLRLVEGKDRFDSHFNAARVQEFLKKLPLSNALLDSETTIIRSIERQWRNK